MRLSSTGALLIMQVGGGSERVRGGETVQSARLGEGFRGADDHSGQVG